MKLGYWQAGPDGRRDANGNILPGDRFEIHKDGRRKRDGGDGVRWSCGCAQYDKLKTKAEERATVTGKPEEQARCKHLQEIFDSVGEEKPLPPQFVLNATGKRARERCACRAGT